MQSYRYSTGHLLLILTLNVILWEYAAGLIINNRAHGPQMLLELKQRYSRSIGHQTLSPNITGLKISPDEAKSCRVKVVKQCYRPIAVQTQPAEVCYYCSWVCEQHDLSSIDQYNWITTTFEFSGVEQKRYSYTECVLERRLSDGTLVLASDKDFCDKRFSGAVLELSRYPFSNTWPDNTTTMVVNGTLSFRFHLNTTNIIQAADGPRCLHLDVYHYLNVKLQLRCNQEEDNMGLYILADGLEPVLLLPDILNDDLLVNNGNSFHIAHAIDTVMELSSLYVNGKLVHSYNPIPTGIRRYHRLYNLVHGLSGELYDFTVYRIPLTQRLVNEVYLKRKVSVTPGNECYCPHDFPLFVPSPSNASPWTGSQCAAIGNFSLQKSDSAESIKSSEETVDRIPDITNSSTNLITPGTNESWISGEAGHATIQIFFDGFYHILGFSVNVQTLPSTLTIKAQQPVLKYSHSCSPPDQQPVNCMQWNDVRLYKDLILVELFELVHRDSLRSDRLELILDGYYGGVDQPQLYVMKDVNLIADCGCMTDRGECVIEDAETGRYSCVCKPEYDGKYCEMCSDGFTTEGIICIPCGCNEGGSKSNTCDKTLGTCPCVDGVDQKEAGPKCNPYANKIGPAKIGPIIGGTTLKLDGMLLDQVAEVLIGNISCKIDTMQSSNMSLYCDTGEADESMVGNKVELFIALKHSSLPAYSTGLQYTYLNNPNITFVSRTKTIQSGGLSMNFGGTELRVIHVPILLINVVCTKEPLSTIGVFEQECRYDTTMTYNCSLPAISSLANITNKCVADTSRRRRQAQEGGTTEQVYALWPGLKLDGLDTFTNLRDVDWLEVGEISVYPDPYLEKFEEEDKIRTFKIRDGERPILVLKGKNLNLAAQLDDYNVRLGDRTDAACLSLTLTELTCELDTVLAPQEDGPLYMDQRLPLVNVTVGSLSFEVGHLYYDQVALPTKGSLSAGAISGIAISILVVLVIGIVIALVLYKRYLSKRRRQEELIIGFNVVESTNSLQTQVQSILIEENLSESLFAHLIPASFVSQEQIIGQGHFGQVYRGRIFVPEKSINKVVAIKSLKPLGLTPKDVVNFVKEALLMKDFHHMNVLQLVGIVYEPSDPESLPLVVTPLMEKGDLKTLISDEFYQFSAGDLLHFGLQISAGMTYLSSLKFIHRDLRAANCMVDTTFIVKVGDFGLSHDVSDTDYYRPQDKSKPLPVKWMALEVLSEQSKYTSQSDVWSFGVLLWELMTRGYQPYADVQNSQIKNYIMNGHRLSKPDLVPDQIYDIMVSCWAVEPDGRPTFEELTMTISNLLKQADGSHHGYQTDYTSPLASVDYMNPNSLEGSQLSNNDDWSTIIPLIKANMEDYADTGRINDDENGSDSETEPIVFMRGGTSQNRTQHGNTSLNQELQRMSQRDSKLNNDYGLLQNTQNLQTSPGQPGTQVSIRTSLSSEGDLTPPPQVPDRPEVFEEEFLGSASSRNQLLSPDWSSDSTNSMEKRPRRLDTGLSPTAFINSICDSLPTPSLEKVGSEDRSELKVPVTSTLSASSGCSAGSSMVYEEALEVRCPVLKNQSDLTSQESMTSATIALDGYLEFETIKNSSTSSSPTLTPEPKAKSNRPPPLMTQLSFNATRKQTLTPMTSTDSITNTKKPVRKVSSTCIPCEENRGQSKISLSTKVPVRSISTSSSLDVPTYEEAAPVWRSKKPGSSVPTTPNQRSPSPLLTGSQLTVTSSVAADGYLEFDAIGEGVSQSELPTITEPDVEMKRKRLNRQDPMELSISPPCSPDGTQIGSLFTSTGSPSDEHLKPVARITPMARGQFDTVVPAPHTKGAEQPAYMNELDMTKDEEPYENVAFPSLQSNSSQLGTSIGKHPIPQVRSSTLNKQQDQPLIVTIPSRVVTRQRSRSIGSPPANELACPKPSLAPSPNTRRRTIQETLNAQVPVDREIRMYGGHGYVNVKDLSDNADSHDYENAWLCQRPSKDDGKDSSDVYQNTLLGGKKV